MTIAGALLSLMASAGAPVAPADLTPAGHPVLDPTSMSASPGWVSSSLFIGPGLRRDDSLLSLPGSTLLALQDAPPAEAPAFGGQPLTNEPLEAEEPREQPTPPSQENQLEGRRRPDIRYPLPEPVDAV